MKLFVPGRICLFGEHSDWAGQYRRINGALERGYTIITGTNQGLYAEVKPHPSKLIYRGRLADGQPLGPFELPMEPEALLAEAQKESLDSYIAGVAYQILTHYRVGGLEIDNYLTDLPVRKGLSSSAAVCVLVARAFNRIYDLKMTVRGEMELAYMGEITTPSRCGRMDQGCAYGVRPILMTYDGDRLEVEELSVPAPLYFVIVDLCAGKDTRRILADLNACYPFAQNELQEGVQKYLGPINKRLVREALTALEAGDAETIGALMVKAQAEFDEHLAPACPAQLTAPVLHKLLAHEPLKPHVFGGKGVGSQGDGTAQFICKDEDAQQKVVEIIERDLKMQCLKLTLSQSRGVRKAVIPAAGFGTRLFPATKALKKELFPVIDRHGRAKPVILAIVEEALSAGVEEVAIIVQSGDRAIFEEFFHQPPGIANFNKLSKENQEYCRYLEELGHRVSFIEQNTQDGFGHAVWCCRDWVGNEPFLLLLGDHLYAADEERSCARQIVDAYVTTGHSVVGLKSTPGSEVSAFGTVTGTWINQGSTLAITEFAEKPSLDYAREQLSVPGLPHDEFLTVFGIYLLKAEIFTYLEESIEHNLRERGEFQLTSCLDRLRKEDGFTGVVIRGRRFDIGMPSHYYDSVMAFRNA